MTTLRRTWPATIAALALAGCTSSTVTGQDNPVISAPATSSSASSASAPASASVVASTPPVTTSPAATTSAVPSSVVTSPAPTAPVLRSTCSRLTIRVIPGGASMGQEIAALQFTNDSTTTCRLVGYPTAVLFRSGTVIGRSALPATTENSMLSIAPGGTAESLLHDYVGNCQAPLSDTLRVTAPGTTLSSSRPMQLRACLVRLDPLATPD